MKKQVIENDVLLERIDNLIDTNKAEHAAILIQTTKTNGRVNKHDAWLNRMIGGIILMNVEL